MPRRSAVLATARARDHDSVLIGCALTAIKSRAPVDSLSRAGGEVASSLEGSVASRTAVSANRRIFVIFVRDLSDCGAYARASASIFGISAKIPHIKAEFEEHR